MDKFDYIVTNSEFNKQQIVTRLSINPDRIIVAHPVITLPVLTESNIYPFEQRNYFIYLGRLEPYKGIIEIINYCIKNNLNLKVIGEG